MKVYLRLNEVGVVLDITTEETEHLFCEVDEDVSIEEIKEQSGFNSSTLKWDNSCLIEVEVNKVDLLEKQVQALTEQLEFRDELIQEMALMIYE